jgi:hypothetical protein
MTVLGGEAATGDVTGPFRLKADWFMVQFRLLAKYGGATRKMVGYRAARVGFESSAPGSGPLRRAGALKERTWRDTKKRTKWAGIGI